MLFVFIFRANRERWQKLPPPPHNLTALKGSVKIAANRDFVDFALNNHKAKDLLEWAKEAAHPDECFFAMLNHNPSLRVRGAYLGKKDKMSGKRHFITKKETSHAFLRAFQQKYTFFRYRQVCILCDR